MTRRGVARRGPLLLVVLIAAGLGLPAGAARAQDARPPLAEHLADAVARSLAASPDQRAFIRATLAAASARHAAELGPLAEAMAAAGIGADEPADTIEARWRRIDRLAARQREEARAIEDAAWRAIEATLTDAQRPRLARVRRAWSRTVLTPPRPQLPLGTVDPFAVLHEVIREQATPAGEGPDRGPQPMVPALPRALAPHAGWLDEQEAIYVASLRRARDARRDANRIAVEAHARVRALRSRHAPDEHDGRQQPDPTPELEQLLEEPDRVMLGSSRELAAFVSGFIAEVERRLPPPYATVIPDRIRASAYDILHADPTAPYETVAAILADPALPPTVRDRLGEALASARDEHRALTARIRTLEHRRAVHVLASEPDELAAATHRISDLLRRRIAVNRQLRLRARELVPAAIRDEHDWPPENDWRIGALMDRTSLHPRP